MEAEPTMGKSNSRRLFVWTYSRGTLPYDIICGLILAFIFLVPKSCFVSQSNPAPQQKPLSSGEKAAAPKTPDLASSK
jgi:hypothetical protein